jgi:hypothetical protein
VSQVGNKPEAVGGPQTFKSREECQGWIDSRVIRFSYSIAKAQLPGIKTDTKTYVPDMWTTEFQKDGGIVLNPSAAGYEKKDGDEPLNNYAKPVRQGKSWIAFMGTKRKR